MLIYTILQGRFGLVYFLDSKLVITRYTSWLSLLRLLPRGNATVAIRASPLRRHTATGSGPARWEIL